MVNDKNETMRGMYNETGGFMAFCHHGFVLVLIWYKAASCEPLPFFFILLY